MLTLSEQGLLVYAPLVEVTLTSNLVSRSLLSEPLNSWERVDTPVNEGPQALYKNGAIYLTYSASFCAYF